MLDPQLLHSIGEASNLDTLTARVLKAANELGFGLVSGVLIQGKFGSPSAAIQSFGNPPAAYQEASVSLADGLRDPVLAKLLAAPGFAQYDQATYVDSKVADLWDLQSAFGYKRGVAVSHHATAHAEAFLLGVDGPDALPTNPVALMRVRAALRLLALQAQQCVERIARPTVMEGGPSEWAASIREGALSYAARGGLVKIEELRRAMQR